MHRLLVILMALCLALSAPAQQKRKASARSSAQSTKAAKGKTQAAKGKTKSAKKGSKKGATVTGGSTAGKPSQPETVKGLQQQRRQLQRQLADNRKRLKANEQDVRQRLTNLQAINHEIRGKQQAIDTLRRDLRLLEVDMMRMDRQIDTLQQQLRYRRQRYIKSLRYMHRNRSAQSKLMFVFSADNFSQMYRRMRFTREYAAFQRAQGEAVQSKQQQLAAKREELAAARLQRQHLLARDEEEHRALQDKQDEQEKVVATLKRQQKTIEGIISQQQQEDERLNQRIDQLIQQEIARQEALPRQREEEAARRRQQEELRRQQEEQRRQKAQRNKVKQAAKDAYDETAAAGGKAPGKKERRRAGRAEETAPDGLSGRATTPAASAGATTPAASAGATTPAASAAGLSYRDQDPDRLLTGSFTSNKGRLPMPLTGSYRIVSRYGQYNVDGLRNVRLDNKGINIQGKAGCQARSVFEGEVSSVFNYGAGQWAVMVRHGDYISVYCNLSAVSVSKGQKVSARQTLGTVGQDNILQFQLRHRFDRMNPEAWLTR